MDVREKLVELIAKAKAMYADDYTDHTEDEYIAETLLDNGVTVQDSKVVEIDQFNKWISVKDRLPEKSGYYLYFAKSPYRGLQGGIGVSYFQHKVKDWKKVYTPCVTHWMPLPQPPKGE